MAHEREVIGVGDFSCSKKLKYMKQIALDMCCRKYAEVKRVTEIDKTGSHFKPVYRVMITEGRRISFASGIIQKSNNQTVYLFNLLVIALLMHFNKK